MKYILKWTSLFVFSVLILMQVSCKKTEGFNEVVSKDLSKPDVVTDIKVTNYNGGATITYQLPKSNNILYVQAQYMINDKLSRESKSSYYSDTIKVEGFAKSQEYAVKLFTVTRANVKSDSVVVMVHPDRPPYLLAFDQLSMNNDFGGVNIRTKNLIDANIGVITILPSVQTNRYEIVDQNYSDAESLNYSLRGYDTLPKQFGVYVTDPWGNISDTLFKTIHPIFEEIMNKALFSEYVLSTDVPSYNNGYFNLNKVWDNIYDESGLFNTQQPIEQPASKPDKWPAWVTFDMGQTAKLSRYTIWDRSGSGNEFVWTSGAPKTWVIWGRSDVPQDEIMPSDSTQFPAVGQKTANGWINLGVFNTPNKPQNNPLTNADIDLWKKGFNYDFSLDIPSIRYIRFECLEIMGGTNNYFNINEMSFYGNKNL